MLALTRRSGESIQIYPDYSKASPDTTIGELFGADGCITITVNKAEENKVSIGIDAIDELSIMRSELR